MSTLPSGSNPIRTRILQASELALQTLSQRALALTPSNYAVFFAYAMGHPQEIRRAIDAADASGAVLDDAALSLLYQHYLTEPQLENILVASTSVPIENVMEELFHSLENLRSENAVHVSSLMEHVQHLQHHLDEQHLREYASAAMETAMALKAGSDSLSSALAASREEINQLRSDLKARTRESERDFLTGAYNRKAWDSRFAAELLQAQEAGNALPLSIALIDIDHFKRMNDTHGHGAGDEVIRQVARLIIHSVKGKDMVARIGGEEFALLLPETQKEGAVAVCEYIRTHIESKAMIDSKTMQDYGTVTVSIGVTSVTAGEDIAPELLLKRADDALYAAKNNGRNRVHCL